ncbi:unnamed protein product [Paramecium octaurelia]|uniref:Uncharacterized protein n=1 Tax=Paramecium octaurelia TaxID=43137 RepID=A0A8S1YJ18_PAROT|nr:unnamed protein product [Paramecium octaurelia]
MDCTYHIGSQILSICIAPHKCQFQRKLCDKCFYEHEVENKEMISISKFNEMVKKKFQECKLEDTSELTEQKMNFKYMLSQSKNNFIKFLEYLSESIKQIFDMIELQTTQYAHLFNQNINPIKLSNCDLEKLISILQGKNMVGQVEQNNFYQNKLEELRVYWDQEEKLFIRNIQEKLSGVLSIIEQQSSKFTGETKDIQRSDFQFKDFQITTTEQIARNREQKFVKDNSSLRKDSIIEPNREPENFTNLEQIQNLKWFGKYGQNNIKLGLWEATWQGEKIQSVGGQYSLDGEKQGRWIEIIKNYQNLAQVFEVGEYVRDQKKGIWKYIYENKEIGGGAYSREGLKIGKWMELSKGFWKYSQVTHQGEYYRGKRIGRWDIFKRKQKSGSFSKIGGGSYDDSGAEVKIGDWVEIMDRFNSDTQIMCSGRYQNGRKIGRWNLYNKKYSIGGGSYDEGCGGVKQGDWVEVMDFFSSNSQLTYLGEQKNGIKVGRWDIQYKCQGKSRIIEGGKYEEADYEQKVGNWVEISYNFKSGFQLILNGSYMGGKKVGRWDIWNNYKGNNEKIEDGSQQSQGDEIKEVDWEKVLDNFKDISQLISNGQYKNGHKVGRWDIWYKYEGKNEKIGGGYYEENEQKEGYWVEISNNFTNNSQITYNGKYLNGKKIGIWEICHRKQGHSDFSKIGCGSYDEEGNELKVGDWVDISDDWKDFCQITYKGEYKNGRKFGSWDIEEIIDIKKPFKIMAGGQYDKVGYGVKLGKWVELHHEFLSQATFHGEYRNGRKVNKWDIYLNQNGKREYIGGGFYDDQESANLGPVKKGKWIELDDRFQEDCRVTHQGEYSNNNKVGRWDCYLSNYKIGGGLYNENGIKDGLWLQLTESFSIYNLVIHMGLVKNGKKVKTWNVMKINIQGDVFIYEKIADIEYQDEKIE